jgi:hypothetical protein
MQANDIDNKKLIFISGRFRSGTSMLWNIFDRLPQYRAWYEPLHPNLLSHINYVKPKEDHLAIDDYWRSYAQLHDLADYHRSDFGQHRLFLEKHETWPELEDYINCLIRHADNKTTVLQFNRADLRLSWLKNSFPNATIIHIERQPFPLWVSSRKHLQSEDDKNNESHADAYDLMQWSADLSSLFPMLVKSNNRSSYYRHYFIWKLAQCCAHAHADMHLSLEHDFHQNNHGITRLAKLLQWDDETRKLAHDAIQLPQSTQQELHKDSRFTDIENDIDQLFKSLGLLKLYPSSCLATIKVEYKQAWLNHSFDSDVLVQELLEAMKNQKDEITALNNA